VFENAAHALRDLLYTAEAAAPCEKSPLVVHGADPVDLMVNWLRELLYMWTGKELLLKQAVIREISDTGISALCEFCSYRPGHHRINCEIKAVTYHQAAVEAYRGGWKARVIFDV